MTAGRELDILIAKKVMGFTDIEMVHDFLLGKLKDDEFTYIPNYSTDIFPAWKVINELKKHHRIDISWNDNKWLVTLDGQDGWEKNGYDTVEEAICMTALKAVVEVI